MAGRLSASHTFADADDDSVRITSDAAPARDRSGVYEASTEGRSVMTVESGVDTFGGPSQRLLRWQIFTASYCQIAGVSGPFGV